MTSSAHEFRRPRIVSLRTSIAAAVAVCLLVLSCAPGSASATPGVATRLIVIKVDGLPQDAVDRYVRIRNPRTGRSYLPWISKLFYGEGVRLQNFFCTGMSLSEPSWSVIDTGHSPLIKGNFEVDRNTGDAADHLNFFSYYADAARHHRVYPHAVEVLDAARIPLLSDAFRFEERETGIQLLRRGTKFYDFLEVGLKPFLGPVSERVGDLLVGVDFHKAYLDTTRDAFLRAVRNPELRYVDYYNADIDATIHDDNSDEAILRALQELDLTIGQCHAALVESHSEDRSIIAVVSDHGATFSDEGEYSQGINLISYLVRREFGAHNILTRQGPLSYYALSGTPLKLKFPGPQTTVSRDSYFLAGRTSQISCAIDFDGNERAQLHFREPDLNRLQMLLMALRDRQLDARQRSAVEGAALEIIEKHRASWQRQQVEIGEELQALARMKAAYDSESEALDPVVTRLRQTVKRGTYRPGAPLAPFSGQSSINAIDRFDDLEQRSRELLALRWQYEQLLASYGSLVASLALRSSITTAPDLMKYPIDKLFGERDLGSRLDVTDLLSYPAGLGSIVLRSDGTLDEGKSFVHINYFQEFSELRVANSVRKELGTVPVDFVAADIGIAEARRAAAFAGISAIADARDLLSVRIVYKSADSQLLMVERRSSDDRPTIQLYPLYMFGLDPASGAVSFQPGSWRAGLPFALFEDPSLDTGGLDRTEWLGQPHTRAEWLAATFRTAEGLGVAGLCETLSNYYAEAFDAAMDRDTTTDARLVRRLALRRRDAVVSDLFLHANPHWNFDLKDFNPGGNHGGFGHASMHGVFWLHGGPLTRVQRGPLVVESPYEGLDVVPTLLEAAGLTTNGDIPLPLRSGGFGPFPGRIASRALHETTTVEGP